MRNLSLRLVVDARWNALAWWHDVSSWLLTSIYTWHITDIHKWCNVTRINVNVAWWIWYILLEFDVMPLNGVSNDPASYCQISLTSSICKIMERLVAYRLCWYIERNRLINKNQLGFRRNRACIDQVMRIQDDAKKSCIQRLASWDSLSDLWKGIRHGLAGHSSSKIAQSWYSKANAWLDWGLPNRPRREPTITECSLNPEQRDHPSNLEEHSRYSRYLSKDNMVNKLMHCRPVRQPDQGPQQSTSHEELQQQTEQAPSNDMLKHGTTSQVWYKVNRWSHPKSLHKLPNYGFQYRSSAWNEWNLSCIVEKYPNGSDKIPTNTLTLPFRN